MRLQRALARAGVASRRGAEELIRGGCVTVNGVEATIGTKVDWSMDVVSVRGRRVAPVAQASIVLHKPVGTVVTRRDPQGRATVFELVPPIPGLTYAGRLDVLTSGLLLLSTDGDLVHRLTHPRFGVKRTYRARVHGRSADAIRKDLAHPIVIDGRAVELASYRVTCRRPNSVDIVVVVREGRNRIVRRVCEKLGVKVDELVRLSHGPVHLGRLAVGEWRYLTRRETAALGVKRTA
ncbi:MAG: pseudouridine synthase [Gemmatimonadales bacterium]